MILGIIFPSGHYTQVSITDPTVDPDTYDLIRGVQEHVLISIPQLMKAFGPIELAHFIAWKGKSYRITELDDVSARFCDRNRMPSLR